MLAILAAAILGSQSMSQLETCEAKLVRYEDWVEAPDTAWALDLSRAPGHLVYIGVEHSRDAEDRQFAMIEQTFAQARPTIVFYEGPDRGIGADGRDTIRTRGESGFVRWLASEAGVPVRTLEPSPIDLFRGLSADYPADQVELFFVLREAARLRDREHVSGPALTSAVGALLSRLQSLVGETTLPFATVSGLETAYASYWNAGPDWRSVPAAWFDPNADDAKTGGRFMAKLNAASSERRNVYMYRALATAALAGERVYAAVGRNHVPMQASALRCAITGETT
jgi:hypothetical protein